MQKRKKVLEQWGCIFHLKSEERLRSDSFRLASASHSLFAVIQDGPANNPEEDQAEGEGNPPAHPVSVLQWPLFVPRLHRAVGICCSSSTLLPGPALPSSMLPSLSFFLSPAAPPVSLPPCSGLDNAGKTTILKKINGEDIDSISPTLGFNIQTLEYSGYKLNVWDVGGQKTIRSYWRNYFEQTDGLIWVVDSADRRRLKDCHDELHALLSQEKLAGASVLIFANKQDLDGALSCEEIAEALNLGSEVFKKRHWQIHSCSAVTGEGLVEGIDWMIGDVASRIFMGE